MSSDIHAKAVRYCSAVNSDVNERASTLSKYSETNA